MTFKESLEICLDLAEQAALTPAHVREEPDAWSGEYERQQKALQAVRDHVTLLAQAYPA